MTFLFIAIAVAIASFLTFMVAIMVEASLHRYSEVWVRVIYFSGCLMLLAVLVAAFVSTLI